MTTGRAQPSAVTRDYVLKLDVDEGQTPLLSIFGGKITTYRRLAEHVLDKLDPAFPAIGLRRGWTGAAPLPGGAFSPRQSSRRASRPFDFAIRGFTTARRVV